MKIQGIIKGNTIELLEDLSLPNGVKISRSIPDNLIQKKIIVGRIRNSYWSMEKSTRTR
ncbi:hypothetical protein MiHa_03552 [Microcystis aeruginosa NIES-2522]|uniref:hypothetical protein n=1 Tax=Microcystis aeruginosa TaxID=1126 RepID=UPI001252CA3C|nr:hypothetical protein [Microcystis aeruginosa]GCA85568.1 hypothetical protein MiHa_03552 [Microcystis aeruginosa NIES-2522]